MRTVDEFAAAVEATLVDSPFVLTRTATGFTVGIDLDDPAWWPRLSRRRLHDTFLYTITCDEQQQHFAIADTRRRIEWRSDGVDAPLRPTVAASEVVEPERQRSTHLAAEGTDTGPIPTVGDSHFASLPHRDAIVEIGERLHWRLQHHPREVRSKWVGIGLIALAVVAVVVVIGFIVFGGL